MQDEGIVQPVSKEMDQLSRRLYHYTPPEQPGGVFFCLFFTILKLMGRYRFVLSLDPHDAAYIAGLIDAKEPSRSAANIATRTGALWSASQVRNAVCWSSSPTVGLRQDHKQTHKERATHVELAFRVTNRQALGLLRQIRPYLRSYKTAWAALDCTATERVRPRAYLLTCRSGHSGHAATLPIDT